LTQRAETAESELLDIKAVLANDEIEERADQDILQKAEQRAEALERALKARLLPCESCVHMKTFDPSPCPTCSSEKRENWQIDIERFGGNE